MSSPCPNTWPASPPYVTYNYYFQANCVQYRLIVRDIKTLQIVHLFTNMDTVQYMEVGIHGLFSTVLSNISLWRLVIKSPLLTIICSFTSPQVCVQTDLVLGKGTVLVCLKDLCYCIVKVTRCHNGWCSGRKLLKFEASVLSEMAFSHVHPIIMPCRQKHWYPVHITLGTGC